jgi:hypothetical protein
MKLYLFPMLALLVGCATSPTPVMVRVPDKMAVYTDSGLEFPAREYLREKNIDARKATVQIYVNADRSNVLATVNFNFPGSVLSVDLDRDAKAIRHYTTKLMDGPPQN